MKSKGISILLITLIVLFSFTPIVKAASIGNYSWMYLGKMGDVNLDWKINSTDSLMVLNASTGKRRLTLYQKKRADVNQNGKVDSEDALIILQYATGTQVKPEEKPEEIVPVASITIKGNKVVVKGEKTKLEAEIYPKNATYNKIEWFSSNTSIATVNKTTGEVTGKKAGETSIILKIDGKKVAENIIKVIQEEVTEITIVQQPTKKDYNIGDKIDLTGIKINVRYNTGETVKNITSGITAEPATVTKVGPQTIKVKYGGKTSGKGFDVKGGILNAKPKTKITTKEKMPEATMYENTNTKNWIVNTNGTGYTNIVSTNMNSNKKAYTSSGAMCLYYANKILGANISTSDITGYQNGTKTNWNKGYYKEITKSSYKEQLQEIYNELVKGNPVAIAVMDEKGNEKYVLAYGLTPTTKKETEILAANIAVIDPTGGNWMRMSQYYQLQEKGKDVYKLAIFNEDTKMKEIKLNKTTTTINANATETLTATVYDTAGNAMKIPKKFITWTSNEDKIATVDANGKVTAKKAGTAKITVTVKLKTGNEYKKECTVTVKSIQSIKNFTITKNSVVKTNASGALPEVSKEELTKMIQNARITSTSTRRQNLLAQVDKFIEIQEKYKVNALFAVAVCIEESAAGTSTRAKNINNWFGIKGTPSDSKRI